MKAGLLARLKRLVTNKKWLVIVPVALALAVAVLFLPVREVSIDPYGRLSLETKITLSIGSGVAYASPDTLYVDDDYNGATPGWGVDHFATITAAIDEASPGDTILVASGNYTENIDVDKQLTLTGDVNQPSNVVVDAGGGGSAITLSVNGCVVQGFKVQNGQQGIYLDNSDNNTLTSNTASSNTEHGIYLNVSSSNTLTQNTVSENNEYGIYINASSGNTLNSNTANSNTKSGIYLDNSDNNMLTSNTASSNTKSGIYLDGNQGSHGNTLTGNTANQNGEYGVYVDNSSNNTLTSNTASSNTEYGIYLDNSSNNTLTSNTASSNTEYGIYLDNSSNNTLTSNSVTGNNIGIKIQESDASTISINCNNINSNTQYGVENSGNGAVDATNNWWGANDGPSGLAPGSGDAVSANVDYDPWLVLNISADPISIVADGSSTSTITADMTKNSNSEDTSTLGHIPDGTQIAFTTNKGSLGNTTVTKMTANGKATATLTSSITIEVAIVTATANDASVATAVFFIPEGAAEVEASKTERTDIGEQTIDAKTEADTEVTKSGNGTPAVTVAKYESNPGGSAPSGFQAVGNYIDVHTDNVTAVDEILIKNYYTAADIAGMVESSLRTYWWDGSDWIECSDTGVDTTDIGGPPAYSGYVWAKIRANTTPDLNYLLTSALVPMGSAWSSPSVDGGGAGGEGQPPPPLLITASGVFTEDAILYSDDRVAKLLFNEGTVGCTKEGEPLSESYAIEMSEIYIVEMEDPPPPPEGAYIIGLVYDFGPDGATFNPPITITFTYDESMIPEGIPEENLFPVWWDAASDQWVPLRVFIIAPELNVITGLVSHFTPFAVLAYSRPAASATFVASNLLAMPTEVNIGETVHIIISIANTGGQSGSYEVTLKINGLVEASKKVTIAAGDSEMVSFDIIKNTAGTYLVDVEGLTGSFMVKEKPVPVTPPVEIPPAEALPAEIPINWPALGGAIGGVIIVGLGIFFGVRREMFRYVTPQSQAPESGGRAG